MQIHLFLCNQSAKLYANIDIQIKDQQIMPPKKKPSPSFEQSLSTLDQLVHTLEKGDLSLEDALKHFEKGVQLAKECQITLTQAEQKVLLLTEEQTDVFTVSTFEGEE